MSGRRKEPAAKVPFKDWARVPRWLFVELRQGRISVEAFVMHAMLWDRATTADLDAGEPTPTLTLEQVKGYIQYKGDLASLQKLASRERGRGRLGYTIAGDLYRFTLVRSLSAACPSSESGESGTGSGIAASEPEALSVGVSVEKPCLSVGDGAANPLLEPEAGTPMHEPVRPLRDVLPDKTFFGPGGEDARAVEAGFTPEQDYANAHLPLFEDDRSTAYREDE